LLRPLRLVVSGLYLCPSYHLCLPLHVLLVADAHELDCPVVDGSVMQHLGQLRSNRPYCLSELLCAHSGNGRQPTERDATGEFGLEGSGSSSSLTCRSDNQPEFHSRRPSPLGARLWCRIEPF
jgi:hypothetical protein